MTYYIYITCVVNAFSISHLLQVLGIILPGRCPHELNLKRRHHDISRHQSGHQSVRFVVKKFEATHERSASRVFSGSTWLHRWHALTTGLALSIHQDSTWLLTYTSSKIVVSVCCKLPVFEILLRYRYLHAFVCRLQSSSFSRRSFSSRWRFAKFRHLQL